MIWLLWIAGVVGWAAYGNLFFSAAWAHATHTLPTVWRNNVRTNRYYRMFEHSIGWALVLPVVVLPLGLWVARRDVETGRAMIAVALMISFLTLKILLSLVKVAADVSIAVAPIPSRTEEAAREFIAGFTGDIKVAVAYLGYTAIAFAVLGVFVAIDIIAVVVIGLFVFYQISDAFRLPVEWAGPVMANTTLMAIIVFVVLGGFAAMPIARPYMDSVGIDPMRFLHGGVVDGKYLDGAKEADRALNKRICDHEIDTLKLKMEAVDFTSSTARITYDALHREMMEKRKNCLF